MGGGSRVLIRRRVAAVLVASAAVAALLTGAASASAAPAQATANAPRAAAADPAIGIDTSDPIAVADAWQALLASPGPQGLTGSTSSCTPGTTTQAYRNTQLATINAMRKLAGVGPWTEVASATTQAQKTAMLMAANNRIDHYPSSTWTCYSADASAGAGSSNLAQGAAGAAAQRAYLEDRGVGNEVAGHRRYLLCGSITGTGFGDFNGFNATKTLGVPTGTWASRDGYVAWPYPGIVPVSDAKQYGLLNLWSLQVPPGHQADDATVSITASSGGPVTANVYPASNGYCENAVTWGVSRLPADGQDWTVTVSGLRTQAGSTYSRTYTMAFTDAAAGVPDAPTGVTATGGNGQASVSWTAPEANGGTITGYTVIPSVGGSAKTPIDFDASATTRTITGLANGSSYTFRVLARTATATGPLSAASAAVLVAGPPSAPTGVYGTPLNEGAVVHWTPPASNGGSPITGYLVTTYQGGSPITFSDATGTSATVLGLVNGSQYTFQVFAINARGNGPQSATSAPVTPAVPTGPAYAPFSSWADFVNRQHMDLTEQAPTTAVRNQWVADLASGSKTKGDLIEALRRGSDNTRNVDPVTRLYRAFLDRTPDAGGLRFWIGRKRAGTWSVTRMADSFASSNEFKTKYGALSNRAFVTRIYTDVLKRSADAAGVTYWTKKLDTRARTRGSVMVGFSESNEYKGKQAANTDVAIAYTFLLGRAPTASEETTWVQRQQASVPPATLATELLESPAYATRITG